MRLMDESCVNLFLLTQNIFYLLAGPAAHVRRRVCVSHRKNKTLSFHY